MKRLRKLLSLVLAGVIGVTSLFCGTVAASAVEKLPYYGYYTEDSGNFTVYFTGVTDDEITAITKALRSGATGIFISMSFSASGSNSYISDSYLAASGSTCSLFKSKIVKKAGIGKNDTGNYYFMDIYTNTDEGKGAIESMKASDSCEAELYVFYGTSNIGGKHFTYNDRSESFTMPFSSSSAKPDFDAFYASHEEPSAPAPAASSGKSLLECPVTAIPDQTYTGKEIKPAITIKDGSKTLTVGTDFTVSYKDNTNVGTATVTITGTGSYADTIVRTFVINPKPLKLKVKKSGSKFKLTWKAVTGTTKYEIRYGEDTDGDTVWKTVKVGGSKKTKTIKLDKSKKYTFQIRYYQTVNGKKYYSEWSKAVKK